MATIATLQRISAPRLAELLLAEQQASPSHAGKAHSSIAVVDVRDDDHIGGHISGSLHFPSRSLDAMMPTLVRRLQGKKTVVFHCALSQQRGPGAAMRYLRERLAGGTAGSGAGSAAASAASSSSPETSELAEGHQQVVYVLDRGFVGWQEVYGEDERLTEGYRKDIWEFGY